MSSHNPAAPRVAITGFAGLDNPEPGLGVARALRHGGADPAAITALVYDPWSPGAWLPGLAERIAIIPPVSHGAAAALARLEELHTDAAIDVLLPCLDLEIPLYGRLASRLERLGIATLLPEPEAVAAVTKTALPGFCHAHGIASPRTLLAIDPGEAVRCAGLIGYPVMVKGTVADAEPAVAPDQVAAIAGRLGAKWGGGVLIQEHIEGDEYVVAMLAGRDGRGLGQVPMRKLGRSPVGKAIAGAVVVDEELTGCAAEILACLNWCGPLELEFVRDRRSGRYVLIEINCRFPAWICLAAQTTINLPRLAIAEALGDRPASIRRKTGGAIDRPASQETRPDSTPGPTPGSGPETGPESGPDRRTTESGWKIPSAAPGAAYVRVARDLAVSTAHIEALRRSRQFTLDRSPAAPAAVLAIPRRPTDGGTRGKLVVAVTGINGSGPVMPGVGTAAALRAAPEVGTVIGLATGRFDTAAYRPDLFDQVFRITPEDPDSLPGRLAELRAGPGLDLVIPCLDGDVPVFIEYADQLARLGIATLLPDTIALARCDKKNLFTGGIGQPQSGALGNPAGVSESALCADRDIGTHLFLPATLRARDWDEAEEALSRIGLPAVFKGLTAGCGLVFDPGQARGVWSQLVRFAPAATSGAGCLVQRYISGDEFAIAGVIGRDGANAGTLAIKKLLRCNAGKTWGATALALPEATREVVTLMRAIGWCGPFEVELMRDALTERFAVLEINPRLPAWIGFSAFAGNNLPRQIVRQACPGALAAPVDPAQPPDQPPDQPSDPDGPAHRVYLRTVEDHPVRVRDFAAFEARGMLRHVDRD